MNKLYNEQMERALLGCMLINNSIIDDVAAKLSKECFQVGMHSIFFENIVNIYNSNNSCDIVMLSQSLPQYAKEVVTLTNEVASTVNYENYTNTIKKFYIARKCKQFMLEKQDQLSVKNVDDVLYELDDFINTAMTNSAKIEPTNCKQMAVSIIEDIQAATKRKGKLEGYDTGYVGLNDKIDGLQDGNLVVIGARPSIGKSTFTDQLAVNLARNGVKTCTFSLEMTQKEIQRRRVAQMANVPIKKIKSSFLSAAQIQRVNSSCQELFDLDMLLYDSSQIGFEFNEVVARIRIHAKQGYKVFFIDHIGLLEYGDNPNLKEFEKISQMTKRLKKLAATLNIVIVAVSQLTRDTEGKEPELNTIRGSGSIEQDANIVLFLHRERQHNNEQVIPAKLIVAKARDGECGTINMEFIPETTKFRELDDEGNVIVPKFQKVTPMVEEPVVEEKVVEEPKEEVKEETPVQQSFDDMSFDTMDPIDDYLDDDDDYNDDLF